MFSPGCSCPKLPCSANRAPGRDVIYHQGKCEVNNETEGRRHECSSPSTYLNPSSSPTSRSSPFFLFFSIMHSHRIQTSPLPTTAASTSSTTQQQSTMSAPIELETLASSPRPNQAYTNDPDASTNRSDALQHNVQGSSSPPDAHPPANVNHLQSSQEVDRAPSPSLHGAARESAGSQRKSHYRRLPSVDFHLFFFCLHASPSTSLFSSRFFVFMVCVKTRTSPLAPLFGLLPNSPWPRSSSRLHAC